MRRLLLCALAFALCAAVPAHAQDASSITIAQYLANWSRIDGAAVQRDIEATGSFDAARHPELAKALQQMREIALAYRERVNAERTAGQTPHSCLPEGEAEITSDILFAHLRSYPAEQQARMTIADAFAELMAKTYPCS
jgi:hypothetical protein